MAQEHKKGTHKSKKTQQPQADVTKEDNTEIRPLNPDMVKEITVDGTLTIEDDVVASIAGLVASEIKGVSSLGKSSIRSSVFKHFLKAEDNARTGVDVEVGKKEAILDLELGIIYGYYIPDVVDEVRRKVAARLKETTGLIAKEINIRVVSIKFLNKKENSE